MQLSEANADPVQDARLWIADALPTPLLITFFRFFACLLIFPFHISQRRGLVVRAFHSDRYVRDTVAHRTVRRPVL